MSDSVELPSQCPSETENAGKSSVCNGCPGQELCKSGATNGRAPGWK